MTQAIDQLAYSVPKAAQRLDIGKTSLWKLIHDGKVKTVKIFNRRLVPDSELQRLMSEAA